MTLQFMVDETRTAIITQKHKLANKNAVEAKVAMLRTRKDTPAVNQSGKVGMGILNNGTPRGVLGCLSPFRRFRALSVSPI